MQLYYSEFSPYSRKVRMVLVELGMQDSVSLQPIAVRQADPGFAAVNPLFRIPALVVREGFTLFDRPVIAEYVIASKPGQNVVPASGEPRFIALRLQAVADGIIDALIPRRNESLRPAERQSPEDMVLWKRSSDAGLDWLEGQVASLDGVHIGAIAVAATLGYLDIRFPHEDWRAAHPKLAAWFAVFSQRPSFKSTVPASN